MSGSPLRATFLPFSRPSIDEGEIAAVIEVLRSGWITTGPKTQEFETKFAEYCGAPHALAVASGTGAEHLVLLALGIGPGDEVITSPMTWPSTVNIIVAVGATPVLADVDPETGEIDPEEVRRKITPKTKAIIPVHFAGLPCDLDRLAAIAKECGAVIIEDAAHAVGTHYKGRPIGAHGHTALFSFHPIKNITTAEGGMITTHDAALDHRLRLHRFHGVTREPARRAAGQGDAGYDIVLAGFKYNMTDIQAALGLVQLSRLEEFISRRTALAQLYLEQLADVEELRLPAAAAGYPARHAWHLFTALVDVDRLDCDRFGFMDALKQENIGTGLHFLAVHLGTHYRERFGFKRGDFPHAERISERVLSLPLFPRMTEDDVDDVVRAVKTVIHRHRRAAR